VLTAQTANARLEDCGLYLLVTRELCPRGAEDVIQAALSAGTRIVQVREKTLPDGDLLEWARLVREWTARAGALLIINDRPDVAVLAEAEGVHLGQEDLPVREARRIVGPRRLVGVSTHTLEQARTAALDGADYVGVGPVFPSGTKAFDKFPGLELVREVSAEISLPAFAIGGISAENVEVVLAAGARRIAASSAVCAAPDPAEVSRKLLSRLSIEARPWSR
jgi:thiamine-phosphate pyrophosphorylase